MKTDADKVAAFRKRLTNRQASWAIESPRMIGWEIDLPARQRITLALTPEQQAMLQRATKRTIPSLTIVMYSDEVGPKGHALACLNVGEPAGRKTAARRPRGSRTART